MHPLNCRNGWPCSVNRQPGHHHPPASRGNQHRRRPASPRSPTQPTVANDHELLADDFAEALLCLPPAMGEASRTGSRTVGHARYE
jgi:hypothetical protein